MQIIIKLLKIQNKKEILKHVKENDSLHKRTKMRVTIDLQ